MLSTRGTWLAAAVCGCVFLAGWAGQARADKVAAKIDEDLATTLGKAVVLAAHPSAKDPALLEHTVSSPKDGRLVVDIKMKYFGKATRAKYTARIRITVDTTKEEPRIVDVDYKDDNKIPSNKKNLKNVDSELLKKLPRKL